MNYFNKLPSIAYNGFTAKNLMARAKLSDKTKNNKLAFYPYTMSGIDRVDILSDDYYDSPGYSWLVWFANDVVDPYYDLTLTDDDFNNHIVSVYGSVTNAIRKIKFFRTNWYNSEESITPSEFDALQASHKRYYNPVVFSDFTVSSYKRKSEDDIVNTNKIQNITLTNSSGTFTAGEEIRVDAYNYATVTASNSSVVACQHVIGAFANNETLTGQTSGVTAEIVEINTIVETIASTDAAFWAPVSFFEYEQEKNEQKKDILLVTSNLRSQAESELKRIMSTR